MVRLLRTAVFVVCLFSAGRAFAAGGTCPSQNHYVNPVTGAAVSLSSLGVTSCFYVAANGSDSNPGTSEQSPWLHAPGMPNCSGVCASVKPAPGLGFILRGGDTWHEGNSGASPYTGQSHLGGVNYSGWVVSQSGSSGSPIYYGVDPTWYSGGSFARPIITGDNPTSTTGVGSCTYPNQLHMLHLDGQTNITVDDFEFTGMCWTGLQSGSACCSIMISANIQGSGTTNVVIVRNYLHGWSHVTFHCAPGPVGTSCDGAFGINETAGRNANIGNVIAYNVIDGSDTDQSSLGAIAWGGYDIHGNVITNTGNGVVTDNTHVFHDNLLQFLSQSSDGEAHTNGFEFNSEQPGTSNAVYNNVIRNIFVHGGGVVQWMTPDNGQTDYYFNNVVYNQSSNGNYFDVCQPGGGSCPSTTSYTVNVFNNTWVLPNSGAIAGPFSGATVNFQNNHCVIPGGGAASNCYKSSGGTLNYLTNVIQTPTTATGQGYSATGTYAYSPKTGSATVGTGTNEQEFCAALSGSSDTWLQQAGAACAYDTGFACTYVTSSHSVSCPVRTAVARPTKTPWDVGAYQSSGSQVEAPLPPTALQATID
jgi:hypothetical protein